MNAIQCQKLSKSRYSIYILYVESVDAKGLFGRSYKCVKWGACNYVYMQVGWLYHC